MLIRILRADRCVILSEQHSLPSTFVINGNHPGSTAKSHLPQDLAFTRISIIMEDYTIYHATPSVENYISLRASAGLTPKTVQAATVGLANTLFAVQIVQSSPPNAIVGMGRMIGDGGCFFQIVDIAVLPTHQGKGLGKTLMKELKDWMNKNVPESGTVLLFADGRANELYRQFGFVETAGLTPTCVGMACQF